MLSNRFNVQKRQQVYSVDVLRLTGQLLLGHPDVYTLWNYRKETLIHFRDRIINQSNANEKIVFELAAKGDDHEPAEDLVEKGKDSIESIDEFEKLLKNELDLTKQALIKNPKSYCVWQHRFWLLELMQQPAYDKELELCDTYLQQDGRNCTFCFLFKPYWLDCN